MDEGKNQINDLEHKEAKNNQLEQQELKRIPKDEDSVSSLMDNFKHSNIHLIGVPKEEKSNKFEIYLKKQWKKTFLICWKG